MRASPPAKTPRFLNSPPCPDYADLSKPAKERIALAARRCFLVYGIYVPLREIAQLAESNEATAIKYYQSHSGLVHAFVQDLIKENELAWKEAEAEYPNDPEAQLRSWIEGIQLRSGDASEDVSVLARVTAQLYRWDPSPLLTQVRSVNGMVRPCSRPASNEYWQGAPKTRSTPCHRNST